MINELVTKGIEMAGMKRILENLGQKMDLPLSDINPQLSKIEHSDKSTEMSRMPDQLENTGREIENAANTSNEIYEQPRTSWEECATKTTEGGKTLYETMSGRDSALLNGELPKNAEIRVNAADGSDSYLIVETDDIGRLKIAHIHLDPSTKEGMRDLYQQMKCRELKDALATDDAGHIWARELGGPSEQINLCPMDAYTNRHGEWRLVERDIKKHLDSGKAVDLQVTPEYAEQCKRPDGFNVKITVDGKTSEYYINNAPTKPA